MANDPFSFQIDDDDILAALRRLQNHCDNLRPALLAIGEDLKESTHKRFETTTDPDGHAWLLNTEATLLSGKEGDQPLYDLGTLGNTIGYQLLGNDGVQIGSPMEYAAMMQFGGTKSEFPNLWGDVPARNFLGFSNEDKTDILTTLEGFLSL